MPNEDNSIKKAVGTEEQQPEESMADQTLAKVLEKIESSDSILVALSRDPSVDEIAAAIGLTLALDKIGKHVTAIYSGKTPNAVQFLEPEKTFESNTNSLQDFIIALDKEKADHLRYKIEGDFVKVYITPYKTTISEKDLEFSHGEVNVDMVISLNVVATEDLDAALAEHGRIMHDAISINISNNVPGRLGGLEWNDASASSVSEMILKLIDGEKVEISKDIATALLTGIVAATDRFSNDKTSPETMAASAELMKYGADQQLIVSHMDDVEERESEKQEEKEEQAEPGSIDVSHEDDQPSELEQSLRPAVEKEDGATENKDAMSPEQELEKMIAGQNQTTENGPLAELMQMAGEKQDESKEEQKEVPKEEVKEEESAPVVESPVLDIPNGAEAEPAEAKAPEIKPEIQPEVQPEQNVGGALDANDAINKTMEEALKAEVPAVGEEAAVPTVNIAMNGVYETPADLTELNGHTMTPVEEEEKPKDYGAMMEEALAEPMNNPMLNPAIGAAPAVPNMPEVQPEQNVADMVNQMVNQPQPMPGVEAPVVAPVPEMQPVAQQMAQSVVPQPMGAPELPPPPAPPVAIDYGAMPPEAPSLPPVQPVMPIQPMPGAEAPVAPAPTPEMQPAAQPMATQPMDQIQTAPTNFDNPAVAASPVPPVAPEVPAVPVAPAEPAVAVGMQDNSFANGIPEMPAGVPAPAEPVNPVVVQPVQDPTQVPPVQDPGAFKIPGM